MQSVQYDSERFKSKAKVGEGAYGIVVKAYDKERKMVSKCMVTTFDRRLRLRRSRIRGSATMAGEKVL